MTFESTQEQTRTDNTVVGETALGGCGKYNFTTARGNQPKTDYCSTCGAHNLALCSGLSGQELIDFGKNSQHKVFQPGQMLFSEFDDAKYFYTVVSGEVRLSRMLDDGRRQITGFKSSGDFVGLSASGQYTADAEAIDEVTVCQFPIKALNASLEEINEVQSRLMEMMQEEVIKLQNHMLLLGRKTPIEKICNFLCERAYKQFKTEGKPEDCNEVTVTLPMSRTDIADFLGLTIETVSRTITKLRKQGIIELQTSQTIEIHDLYELQLLAEGEK